MKNSKTDFDNIADYLNSQGIEIDYEEFIYQVQTHPDYPSLLALSDVLNFFNVKHSTFKIKTSDIDNLPNNFIGLINVDETERFIYIQKRENGFTINKKRYSDNHFLSLFAGIVLIVEKNEFKQKRTKSKVLYLFLSFIILITFLSFFLQPLSLQCLPLFISAIMGFVFSLEIFRQIIGRKSILSGICNISLNTDCERVVTSRKWNFFKYISFSDISITFFIIQIILLLIYYSSDSFIEILLIYKIGLWLTIPLSFVSIYYQWKIEKKWCILCLSIITILYIQLVLLHFFVDTAKSIQDFSGFFKFLLLVTGVSFAWLKVRDLLMESKNLKETLKNKLRLTRNFSLFEYSLYKSVQLEMPISSNSIYYEQVENKHALTIITSPFCGHCTIVHANLNAFLKTTNLNINIHIVFNIDTLSKDVGIYNYFHKVFKNEGFEQFHTEYLELLTDKDGSVLKRITDKSKVLSSDDLVYNNILETQRNFCIGHELFFTPTILIDGYKFPNEFDKNDLQYFLLEISDKN